MLYEENVSAKQDEKKEDDRLPRAHENRERPQDHQPPPQSRPQNPLRVKFPKEARLLTRRQFQRVSKEGSRKVGSYLCVDCRPANQSRLGISASAKYGSSPERNRFKRLVREAFRTSKDILPTFELHVIPRQRAKHASCSQVKDELVRLVCT